MLIYAKDNGNMGKKKTLKRIVVNALLAIKNFIWIIICSFAALLLCSVTWMFNTWKNLNMEELVYQLKSPIQGTSSQMLWDYFYSCGLPAILVAVTGIVVICLRKRIINYRTLKICMAGLAAFIIALSTSYTWDELDVSAYVQNQSTYSTFIEDHYANPEFTDMEFPVQKRNLIYIFLESMETTYTDEAHGGGFKENVIPELTDMANEYECFAGNKEELNGGYPMTGTTWTAGAMFGQTSGLPLNLPIGNDDMYTQDSFMPDIVTLGDVLQEEGYEQTLLIGSYALFSGRDKYFSQHGGYNICDYAYSINNGEIPEDYYVWWGYEDKKLFEHAKIRLQVLAAQDQPFNLTMLTADTHFEDGYLCPDCEDKYGDNIYANVMACSSKRVSEFVEWIQAQDFYENTTIVITGDHLTMDSDFCNGVEADYPRKVYTVYINSAVEPVKDEKREYTTFDNFPTTLAALGVDIEGECLGLGTNLFSDVPTLVEQYGYEKMNTEIARKSRLMEEISQNINVDKTKEIKEQEKERQEKQKKELAAAAETAQENAVTIEVTPYDYEAGKFSVIVRGEVLEEFCAVQIPVWSETDQSDMIWYTSALQADGSYLADIWANDFMNRNRVYTIHVYGITVEGQMSLLGGTEGIVA